MYFCRTLSTYHLFNLFPCIVRYRTYKAEIYIHLKDTFAFSISIVLSALLVACSHNTDHLTALERLPMSELKATKGAPDPSLNMFIGCFHGDTVKIAQGLGGQPARLGGEDDTRPPPPPWLKKTSE